jgi:hypothetical protein
MPRHIIVCLLALVLGGPALAAQDQADLPEGRANRPAADRGPFGAGEVAAMLDAYALVQAQDALKLTDEQYASFVTGLKRLQQTRRRYQQARSQIVRELARLTAPAGGRPNAPLQGDEATIAARLKALREHDERAAAELRQAYDALDEVLDVRQQGRFRVFEERIEVRKFDLLMRARQGAARGRAR